MAFFDPCSCNSPITRRDFIKTTLAGAVVAAGSGREIFLGLRPHVYVWAQIKNRA